MPSAAVTRTPTSAEAAQRPQQRQLAKKPPATATVASFPSAVAPTVKLTALPGRLTVASAVNSTLNRNTPKAFRVPFRSKL